MTLNDNEVTLFGSFTFDDVEYEFLRHVNMPCEDEAIMVPAGRYLLAREKVVTPKRDAFLLLEQGDLLVLEDDGKLTETTVLSKDYTDVVCAYGLGLTKELNCELLEGLLYKIYRNGEVIWQRK